MHTVVSQIMHYTLRKNFVNESDITSSISKLVYLQIAETDFVGAIPQEKFLPFPENTARD